MFNIISALSSVGLWDIVLALFSTIPKLIYLMCNSLCSLLDILQMFFRKLVGLDVYYVSSGAETTQMTGDIVEEFIVGTFTGKYPVIANVFWSFIILGVILLFVTTIVAIIRNEYTPDKSGGNSKTPIINRSIKALLTFAIVPVVTIFGMYLCNIILRALDSASSASSSDSLGMPTTNLVQYESTDKDGSNKETRSYISYSVFGFHIPTNATPFSGMVFKVSAYNANRVRVTNGNVKNEDNFLWLLNNNQVTNFGGTFTGQDYETVASYIDSAFANNVKFKEKYTLSIGSAYQQRLNITAVDLVSGTDAVLSQTVPFATFDRYRVGVVWYYYDLWQFDFITSIAAVVTMLTVFISIIIGLMKRFFEVIGLFLISPPIVALMPLDDGKAFDKWKGKFISKIIGGYGAVVGMNLMFIMLPLIYNITFFNIAIVDRLIQCLFIIVGLLTVKSLIALVSDLAGADDYTKAGADMAKDVGATIAKVGAGAVGMGRFAVKAAGALHAPQAVAEHLLRSRHAENEDARLNADKTTRQTEKDTLAQDVINRRKNIRQLEEDRKTNNLAYGRNKGRLTSMGIGETLGSEFGTLSGTTIRDEAHRAELLATLKEQNREDNAVFDERIAADQRFIDDAPERDRAIDEAIRGIDRRINSNNANRGFWNSYRNHGLKGGLLGLIKHTGGLAYDTYKDDAFYKGYKDEGGTDSLILSARGKHGDFKKFKAAKDEYERLATSNAMQERLRTGGSKPSSRNW